MPRIQYKDLNLGQKKLEIIDTINGIIREYHAQGYELTLRQVYYQLVARGHIENTERSYKNIGVAVNDGRLAGLIDWNAIVDRTRNLRGLTHWDTPEQIINATVHSYRLDRWETSDKYVEVWVEKDALVGVVGAMCNRLDVPYFSCRGYVSQSEMWNASQRFINDGRPVTILHLGDHDPSGIDMTRDITERLEMFGADMVTVKRIALTMEQIRAYNPPPNPAKLSDTRAKDYIAEYGYESWELDALEPKVIEELIATHVGMLADSHKQNLIEYKEIDDRRNLRNIALNYDTVIDLLRQLED